MMGKEGGREKEHDDKGLPQLGEKKKIWKDSKLKKTIIRYFVHKSSLFVAFILYFSMMVKIECNNFVANDETHVRSKKIINERYNVTISAAENCAFVH